MNFIPKKGTIALDIDGTLTGHPHKIEDCVIDALNFWEKMGWNFIFITGRTFQTSIGALAEIPFPYVLAVQNGASLLEMPSKKILLRNSLDQNSLKSVEKMGQEFEAGLIVYAGFDYEDQCYYCPHSLFPDILSYGLKRAAFLNECWEKLDSFSDLPIPFFSSIKFFLNDERAFLMSRKIEKELGLHAPPNRDPYNLDYFVLQITHREANKGSALKEFIRLTKNDGPIIAAGDDHNDLSMLKAADMKVVMASAPSDLLAIADIIAPPADEMGIIQGINEAIAFYGKQ